MSQLTPCPSCNRHVRAGDSICPFCRSAVVSAAPARAASPAGVRGRLGRAALFAAGATLMGMSACSDPKCTHATCSGPGVAGMDGGAAGAGGGAGGSGSADAGGTDADGPVSVPIYSAVFPPPEQPEPGAAFARAKDGKPPARS